MKTMLPCPCCGKRLTDTEHTVNSEVIPMSSLLKEKGESWIPDYYVKCWNCKQEIAIKKVS